MRHLVRRSLVVCALLTVAACAGAGKRSPDAARPRTRTDLITPVEIQSAQWASAYDLVNNLRPQWLRSRGPDTIRGRPGEVQVVLDGVRLGGVGALRSLPASGISFLQFYDGITAAARWGAGFGNGAIYITTGTR